MGLRIFDGKTLCAAWDLKLSDKGKAAQATQAFQPFADKLQRLAIRHPRELMLLIATLIEEAESDQRRQHKLSKP